MPDSAKVFTLNPLFPGLQLFNVYSTRSRIYIVGCSRVNGGVLG